MTGYHETHGRGTVETRSGAEIPVYYNLLIEQQETEDGSNRMRMSGRLRIEGDPWLESTVVEEGYVLVLQDGQRLRVRVQTASRTSETLPFMAAPLDE